MMWKGFLLATLLFFGWFAVDTVCSLLGSPLQGIWYPMASGTLKHVPPDWTMKPVLAAPLYLAVFGGFWALVIGRAGLRQGLRVAALFTAFAMAPFWIVSCVSVDMYGLEISGWWLASMIYCNVVFLLFGFVGRGRAEDLYF